MTRWLLLCNDLLRLDDKALLSLPAARDVALLVCILPAAEFRSQRASSRRLQQQLGLLLQFQQRLANLGIPLLLRHGKPSKVLRQLCAQYQINRIAAAEPTAIDEYRWGTDLPMQYLDLNSLLADDLRPDLATLPRSFTAFRQQREPLLNVSPPHQQAVAVSQLNGILNVATAIALSDLPPMTTAAPVTMAPAPALAAQLNTGISDWQAQTETAALARFEQYLQQHLSHYKLSRNALIGADFASFLSIPLSKGTLSVRLVWQLILQYEHKFGQSESSYWLRFELLWREYFRHLQRKHPLACFRHQGLGLHLVPGQPGVAGEGFERWCRGEPGCRLLMPICGYWHKPVGCLTVAGRMSPVI